jgi:NAD+ synthase (glutamine-hydrolysing)
MSSIKRILVTGGAGFLGSHLCERLVADGHDPALVARVVHLVDGAEYKRRQSPPGLRVTTKAFGKDRRLPITNAYRG